MRGPRGNAQGSGRAVTPDGGSSEAAAVESRPQRRRTQVVKGEVCKTFIRRFESARRLHLSGALGGWTDFAGVAELVDARDLKSRGPKGPCRFESGLRHH